MMVERLSEAMLEGTYLWTCASEGGTAQSIVGAEEVPKQHAEEGGSQEIKHTVQRLLATAMMPVYLLENASKNNRNTTTRAGILAHSLTHASVLSYKASALLRALLSERE